MHVYPEEPFGNRGGERLLFMLDFNSHGGFSADGEPGIRQAAVVNDPCRVEAGFFAPFFNHTCSVVRPGTAAAVV